MHEPNKLTGLIIANCADVLTFALSRASELQLRAGFMPLPTVDKILIELPEQKADRALLELGALLRALDDTDDVKAMLIAILDPPYGTVLHDDGSREDL